ncbi:hypothetical protein JW835_05720 [bacterium]|nr:hypothetical protein [bacterium]
MNRSRVLLIFGRVVATLVNKVLAAGVHFKRWNASENPSGVYFCRLATNTGFVQTKKIILLK